MGNRTSLPQSGRPPKKPLSPEARKQAYLLIMNSIILLFIYFGAMGTNIVVIPAGKLAFYPITLGQIVYVLYWIAFAVLILAYLIYNRGFSRKGITADMLPVSWSLAQKEAYIAESKSRMARSKWMLSLIIPLLVSIAADAIYLFTWPLIENLFS